jgi:predicted aspartyl protease
MSATIEPSMGRFSVDLELVNDWDLAAVAAKALEPAAVRRATVRGVVDTGATRLVIPEAVGRQLGLTPTGRVRVRYADGRAEERPVVEHIRLSYAGRSSVFNGVLEPARDTALIGAIVLEDLDLIVDCTNQRLVPRDPNIIVSEIE